ncbi:glycosyltransferase family 1 protein [Bacillus sp. AK128]
MGGPLRVLHVVVNMNRGGAETLIMNLYRNIDRSKVQFDFLTNKEGVFDSEIRELGGVIHRIPYITDVGHFGYVKALDKFFKNNNQYKIVHSHLDKMSGLVLRVAKKANIPKRIAHSHNTRSEGGLASRMYKTYAGSFITKSATEFFACSNTAAKWLFNRTDMNHKILNNGIESDKFAYNDTARNEIREELNIPKSTVVLGHVGRFNHQKNHQFLIEVFAEYKVDEPNAVLVLVGEGVLKNEIEQKVKKYNLIDSVKFLGVREDIHCLLQAFDVFVFPSLHEGLPVTLIEAQASGLPCIISDTITTEVDMGLNLIHFNSLSNKDHWIQTIRRNISPNRKINNNILIANGYDIRQTAKDMQASYLSLVG